MSSLRDRLYSRLPLPLQNAAISLYGLYLRSVRHGRGHQAALARLSQTRAWTADQILAYQNERLDELVRHAIQNVPFYQAKYGARLPGWGATTVANLPDRLEILDQAEVKRDARSFHTPGPEADRMTVFTSGSTGAPLEVLADKAAVAENFAFFSQFLQVCGVDAFDRSITFAGRLFVPKGQSKPPYWRYNMAMRTWLFSSYHISEATIPAYLEQIERINPVFIDSYPSSLYAIARHAKEHGLKPRLSLRAIVTSSETLSQQQRSAIEEVFGCRIYDQYGCAEMAAFIYQCPAGSYHSHPLYGIVEVTDADGRPCAPGEVGDLVLTGLLNPAMPLIRYRIGDRAALGSGTCACGAAHPIVERLVGREDDFILTPEGNLVGRLDPLFKGLRGIVEAQIVQHDQSTVEVLLVPSSEYQAGVAEGLVSGLRDRVGPTMRIDVNLVKHIPRGSGGKFRSVVSKLGRAQRQRANA